MANSSPSAGYLRDVNLSYGAGDDYSNPYASASGSQTNKYKEGGVYNVSGRQNTGLGLGKVIVYTCLGLGAYWLYRKVKK